MTYTPDGQLATLTALNPTTGDQTTRYVYGSTLVESFVARSDLLRAEIYPDSDDSRYDDGEDAVYDRIEYSYNAQGQRKSLTDQNGTVRGFLYDKLGRLLHDYAECLGGGVDGRVRRISRTYGLAGRLEKVTSYTAPYPKTGAIVSQVRFVYSEHGLPVAEYQSHDGAVDMAATPKVEYGYDDTAEGGEFVKGLRPTRVIYPNGRIVRYEYADAASSSSSSGAGETDPNDCLNRVKFIADDDQGQVGTHLAEYQYLGVGAIVMEDYLEPQVKLDYTADGYSGFDRFGRVIDHRWHNYAAGEDLDRYQYGHDRAGSRTFRRNATTTERDESYLYDGLNRLVRADRGNLDPAVHRIAGTPERQESWSLDATGNWSRHTEREAGAVTLDQSRQHNRVNELLSFSTSVGNAWSNPTHDRNGNMTRLPKPSNPGEPLTLRWDAWDRLVKVTDSIGLVAEYSYDGRNFRITSHTYRDTADRNTVLDTPNTRYFFHNDRWQVLEERTADSSSLPERQFVWSLRYIDAPILRDRRTLADPTALNERLYYLGDANFNVTALFDRSGEVVERYAYTPYGEAAFWSPEWLHERASSAVQNVVLFTGRDQDLAAGLHYYRARWYDAQLGRFVGHDPIGFLAGDGNLYDYCAGMPTGRVDPSGLVDAAAIAHLRREVEDIENRKSAGRPLSACECATLKRWRDLQVWLRDNGYDPSGNPVEPSHPLPVPAWVPLSFEAAGQLAVKDVLSTVLGRDAFGLPRERTSVGQPSTAEQLVPLWGTARSVYDHVQNRESGPAALRVLPDILMAQADIAASQGAGLVRAQPSLSWGSVQRPAPLWFRGAENDEAWLRLSLREKLYYDIGQKTLANFDECDALIDPITRGQDLVRTQGLFRAIRPEGSGWYLGVGRTFRKGPAPSVRWVVPRFSVEGAANRAIQCAYPEQIPDQRAR